MSELVKSYTISDIKEEIILCLDEAKQKSDLILITGGLGPTSDDITKETLSDYFGMKLVFNQEASDTVAEFFKIRNLPYTERNKSQGMLPEGIKILENKNGTAPGMWFEQDGKVFVSMPGIPYEMQGIMNNQVLNRLQEKIGDNHVVYRHVLCIGIGEAFLSDKLAGFENDLPENIKLAYLPHHSKVKLRLTTQGADKKVLAQKLDVQVHKVKDIIGKYIYGYEDETLERIVGNLLKKNSLSIGTAESCTGGYIAHLLTSVSGSSAYFSGSCITYSNEMKTKLLNVEVNILNKYGAVSEEVVGQMLDGIFRKLEVDCAIAVSGIAGPTGGTKDKPVGTVWVGVAYKDNRVIKKFLFNGSSRKNTHRINNR